MQVSAPACEMEKDLISWLPLKLVERA
jgi:hypothetical protein